MTEWLDLTVKYGLGIVLSLGAVYALWKITSATMRESSKREERYASLLENHIGALQHLLSTHDQRAVEAISGMQEAHRHQREEHEKMMQALTEMLTLLRGMARGA